MTNSRESIPLVLRVLADAALQDPGVAVIHVEDMFLAQLRLYADLSTTHYLSAVHAPTMVSWYKNDGRIEHSGPVVDEVVVRGSWHSGGGDWFWLRQFESHGDHETYRSECVNLKWLEQAFAAAQSTDVPALYGPELRALQQRGCGPMVLDVLAASPAEA